MQKAKRKSRPPKEKDPMQELVKLFVKEIKKPKTKKVKKPKMKQVPGMNLYLPIKKDERQKAIVDYLIKQDNFLWTGPRSRPYLYSHKQRVWEKTADVQILGDVTEILARLGVSNPSIGDNVLKDICRSTYKPISVFESTPLRITVRNGIIDLERRKFTSEHHPEEYHIQAIPWDYDPEARCPKIRKFFKEVVPKNVKTIEELVGYFLYKTYTIKTAIMFLGDTNSAKTTLIKLLQRFLGKRNYSAIPLHELSWPFEAAQMLGKLANFGDELEVRDFRNVGVFKRATGEGEINAQRKFEHPFKFNSHAKQVHATNRLPFAPGAGRPFYERWFVIPFEQRFPKSDPRTLDRRLLLKSLTTPEEMSGLLNLAIRVGKELMEQGKFTGDDMTPEEKMVDWKRRATKGEAVSRASKLDDFDEVEDEDRRDYDSVYNFLKSYELGCPTKRKLFWDYCKARKAEGIKTKMSSKKFGILVDNHPNWGEGPRRRIKGKSDAVETWLYAEGV